MIRPFYDAPEITIPWMWYAVPEENPTGPATIFTDRFWDKRDNYLAFTLGTVPESVKPYFGVLPSSEVTPLFGTPDEWANGLSYAKYLNNEYHAPCVPKRFVLECDGVIELVNGTVNVQYVRQVSCNASLDLRGDIATHYVRQLTCTGTIDVSGSGVIARTTSVTCNGVIEVVNGTIVFDFRKRDIDCACVVEVAAEVEASKTTPVSCTGTMYIFGEVVIARTTVVECDGVITIESGDPITYTHTL